MSWCTHNRRQRAALLWQGPGRLGHRRLSGILQARLTLRRSGRQNCRAQRREDAMADIRVIATGLRFPEGPMAMADGSVILGEIAGGTVTRVMPDGAKTLLSNTDGGPNGLALGPDATLYLCNNGGNKYAEGGFFSTGPVQGLSRRLH